MIKPFNYAKKSNLRKKLSDVHGARFFCRRLLGLLALLVWCWQAQAQEADDYAFSTNLSGNLVDMQGSTLLLPGGSVRATSANTPLGFEFWFMGVRYTSFSVNANGVLQLGTVQLVPTGNTYNIPNRPRLAVFAAGDVSPNSGDWVVQPAGRVHYRLTGQAPNRVLVVEWSNLGVNLNSTTADAVFQALLYQTAPSPACTNGGRIEFRYGPVRTTVLLNSIRIGIGSGAARNQYKAVDLGGAQPTARISDTEIENRAAPGPIAALNATPNNLRVFVFEPPLPNGQASQLASRCLNGSSVELSWQNAATNAVGTVLYKSTDGGASYQFLAQVNGNTYTDTGLQPNRDYFYRAYAVTEGKLSELQSTGQLRVRIGEGGTQPVAITGQASICEGQAALLQAPQGLGNYLWADEQGRTLGTGQSLTVSRAGTYTLTAGSDNPCFGSSQASFTLINCCEATVEIPTAFTPHNTPANNVFRVGHQNIGQFKMQIYNRWGNLVFESTDPEQGWDGTANGQKAQADAYQVVVEYAGCSQGRTARQRKTEVLYLLE